MADSKAREARPSTLPPGLEPAGKGVIKTGKYILNNCGSKLNNEMLVGSLAIDKLAMPVIT